MPLSYELKQLLRANAAKEPEQVTARNSQALRLNLDGRHITLVNRMGMSTEAGRYFYRTVRKQPLPDSRWDDDAPTYRKPGGRTDYVRTRANQEVVLRTWNPAKKILITPPPAEAFTSDDLNSISCKCPSECM